jgi:6-phosphogluconolactonase
VSVEIRIVDDPLAECAALLTPALAAGPVVLTGGSTTKAYTAMDPAAWAGAQLWFSDERCVPVSDERSNYGGLRAAVGAPLAAADVEWIDGTAGPDAGAVTYEAVMRERGVVESGFELFLVGLGPDAHICSMFPDQESLSERTRLTLGVPVAGLDPRVPRVTLTFPALALARHVVVMAAGAGKADALSAAFAEDAPVSRDVPASLLPEFCERITVLTDLEGAARL